MEEATTYHAIREEGALREARKNLLLVGNRRFQGTPSDARTAMEGITDLDCLEKLLVQSQLASSWEELLGQPATARRSRRRKPKA